jgi:hypothetical protein
MGRLAWGGAGLAFFLFVVVWQADAEQVKHPDFSGKWEIDRKASDDPDPLLKIEGRSSVERFLARRAKITQEITQTPTELIIRVKDRVRTLPLDGRPGSNVDREGNTVISHSRWSDDGKAIITKSERTANERKINVTIVRRLSDDGDTMTDDVVYEVVDGETITLQRVFRRID